MINSIESDSLIVFDDDYVSGVQLPTYGRDVNSILRGVMKATERPLEVYDSCM